VAVGAATEETKLNDEVVAEPVPFCVVRPLFIDTVKLPVAPVPVGVPLMTPVEVFSDKPAGSEPLRLKVNGPVPVVGKA
jgi:hypothetical protein